MNRPLLMEEVTENVRRERAQQGFLRDVAQGLAAFPKAVPCRWLYDAEGSRIFEEIMALPEYYLSRCEAEILAAAGDEVAAALEGEPCYILDLGSGNGDKTRLLLRRFLGTGTLLGYVPIDMSGAALKQLEASLRAEMPSLRVGPLEAAYLPALERFRPPRPARKLALFLGSSIGNYDRMEALAFLQGLADRLDPDDLVLIGFDLRKDPELIRLAYDDPAGVTARFNLNLLDRINRELGGDFNPDAFRHKANYDERKGVMRSYLISQRAQEARVAKAGCAFVFEDGEALHTENCFKYSREEIERMARIAGFSVEAHFTDSRGMFLDSLWRVGAA